MGTTAILGGKTSTLVAGTFRNPIDAADAARRLQDRLPTSRIRLVQPEHAGDEADIEPDPQSDLRALTGSPIALGSIGAVAGLLVASVLVGSDWSPALASPVFLITSLALGGAMLGQLLAGLLTRRPDRGYVIWQVRNRTRHGQWAVVADSSDEASADSASTFLQDAGGEVVRSL